MLNGIKIDNKEQIRYLGVELSRVWGFRKHIEKAAAKASSTASNLARIMPNVGGASHKKRKIFGAIVYSQTLYAAPIWAHALEFDINKSTLLKPQRIIALRIAMGYRTVSTEAILVVAGIIPAHLMALERLKSHKDRTRKDTSREESFTKWQDEWNETKTGRRTRRMIPDVKKWATREHGEINFHLTQMLTGHGCFREYLHRFKRTADTMCVDCFAPRDDADHAIFHCDRRWRQRRDLEVMMEKALEPEVIVDFMLKN